MEWFSIVIAVVILAGAAGFWGYINNPKHGGTTGCCGCGQCVVTGECVMVKKKLEKSEKKTPIA